MLYRTSIPSSLTTLISIASIFLFFPVVPASCPSLTQSCQPISCTCTLYSIWYPFGAPVNSILIASIFFIGLIEPLTSSLEDQSNHPISWTCVLYLTPTPGISVLTFIFIPYIGLFSPVVPEVNPLLT